MPRNIKTTGIFVFHVYLSEIILFYSCHVEVAALIAVCQRLRAVKLSPLVAVVALIHITEAWDKFEAAFPFAELADAAFGVDIIKFVHAFLIVKLPVKLVF